VRYFDSQFLRTQDFTQEQEYHVALRRRHNLSGHTWGIVHGLRLAADAGAAPTVEPGVAVDGYGREVVVLQRLTVPPLPPPPVTGEIAYDVWLCYDRVGSDRAPDGFAPCGAAGDAYYRWQELPRLLITEADEAVDPDRPPGVPEGDLQFGPERTAPEETRPWPVLLGRVRRDEVTQKFTVDSGARRYAGVVAASVTHPVDATRVDLGPADADDPTRFAVRAEDGVLFDITEDGVATAHGGLAVNGDLRIDGGTLEFPAAGSAPVEAASSEPNPWRVYGYRSAEQHELRVELPEDPESSLVVGTWSNDDKSFKPCLTVSSAGTVTVHGTLHVRGVLRADGGVQTQRPGAATRAITTGAMLSGIAGAAGVAARLYRPKGTGSAQAQALAAVLAADPDLLAEVAGQLREEHGAAATAFADHLGAEG
jgi:hypothetical protein